MLTFFAILSTALMKTEIESEMTTEYAEDDDKNYHSDGGDGDMGTFETGSHDNGEPITITLIVFRILSKTFFFFSSSIRTHRSR